jgi:hypothetical protein
MFEVQLWTEITVGLDTDLDNKIFQEEINLFKCEECGNIGYAMYPIKIGDKESGEKTAVIPASEAFDMAESEEVTAEGFIVLEVTDKELCRIFYSLEDMKWQICYWQGGDDTVFDPPPRERDIVEGLQKGIIDEHEAVLLRNVDWETLLVQINQQADENDGECEFGDERDDIIDLYMKFMSALNCARKVVPLRPEIMHT